MTITVNRKRFPAALLIFALITTSLTIFSIDIIKHFNDPEANRNIYLITFGGLSIYTFILTIFAFVDYMKTLFDKKATLTISSDGVNDNLSIISCGNISWTEIEDIKLVKALKTDFLVIMITNPKSFIENQSMFKRRALKTFLKHFGSPIVISQKIINYKLTDLKDNLLRSKNG